MLEGKEKREKRTKFPELLHAQVRSIGRADRSIGLSLTVRVFGPIDRALCRNFADRSDPVQKIFADRSDLRSDRSEDSIWVQWILRFLFFLGFRWDLGYPLWTHLTICEASWADALHGWFECIEVQSISISNGMGRRDISSISKYKTISLVIANSIPFED